MLESEVFFAVALKAALFVAREPALGHFFVPVGAGDLVVGRGCGGGSGLGIGFIGGLGFGLGLVAGDLGG